MPRKHQATALILGRTEHPHPVYALLAPLYSSFVFAWARGPAQKNCWCTPSPGLVVLWYTLFALLASTSAREQGTAVAFGIGVWFFFTFLWALVTTMVAYVSGVAVGEANDPAWVALEGMLDLLSPNGVYHHLLETQLPTVERGVAAWQSWGAALLWTVLPWLALHRRMERLVP